MAQLMATFSDKQPQEEIDQITFTEDPDELEEPQMST